MQGGRRLKHELSAFYRGFTLGDGSCFFHSLAQILGLNGYEGKDWESRRVIGHSFRQDILNSKQSYTSWLRRKGFDNVPGILTYDQAKDSETYAEECLINYTASRLNLTLVLVRNRNQAFIRYGKSKQAPVAMLAWIDDCHFEPILRCEVPEKAPTYVLPTCALYNYTTKHLIDPADPLFESMTLL